MRLVDLPGMPATRSFTRAGVRLAFYQAGGAGAGAPPIVFCHGFPETAYSWRHQLAGLAAQGFHVIALDQRGYGQSDCPPEVEAYDLANLTGDLTGLLDHLGIERAVFCGHDWGGIVVWAYPLRSPERVAGVIGLNTPYSRRAPVDPVALFEKRFGPDFYIVQFNRNRIADAVMEADVERTLRCLYRRPQPEAQTASGGRIGMSITDQIATFDKTDRRQQLLSDAELAVFAAAFARTGFTPGINWYRNFTRNWDHAPAGPDRVDAPALMIMAELDLALPPAAADGMEKYVPNLQKVLIPGCGHWTQQEKPEDTNRIIADWMRRVFPPR